MRLLDNGWKIKLYNEFNDDYMIFDVWKKHKKLTKYDYTIMKFMFQKIIENLLDVKYFYLIL